MAGSVCARVFFRLCIAWTVLLSVSFAMGMAVLIDQAPHALSWVGNVAVQLIVFVMLLPSLLTTVGIMCGCLGLWWYSRDGEVPFEYDAIQAEYDELSNRL